MASDTPNNLTTYPRIFEILTSSHLPPTPVDFHIPSRAFSPGTAAWSTPVRAARTREDFFAARNSKIRKTYPLPPDISEWGWGINSGRVPTCKGYYYSLSLRTCTTRSSSFTCRAREVRKLPSLAAPYSRVATRNAKFRNGGSYRETLHRTREREREVRSLLPFSRRAFFYFHVRFLFRPVLCATGYRLFSGGG